MLPSSAYVTSKPMPYFDYALPSSSSSSAAADRQSYAQQAGGNVGRFMVEALLKTGKHTVTAITRQDSQTSLPDGVEAKVDYSKPETLVEALRGQDALIITISGYAPIQETEEKLVRAAGDAGVPWI